MMSGIVSRHNLTIPYSVLQASFWMDLCISLSFAAVYLQGLGYSNSGLGLIIASGSLIGAASGPLLSSLIDSRKDISAHKTMRVLAGARAAVILVLLISTRSGAVTSACFTAYIGLCLCVNSMILKLYADASFEGKQIDYGIARGCGSLAYVLLSIVLGSLVAGTSIRAIPAAAMAVCLFQIASLEIFVGLSERVPSRDADTEDSRKDSPQEEAVLLYEFARRHPGFCLMLAGTLLIFYSHNTVCNYLINVVENIGGDTGSMGFLNGFMAAVEIPVMFTFTRFFGKRDMAAVLRVAFIVFTLKAAAIAAAGSMVWMTAAFVLQAPSFALYTSAIVPYIEEHIPHGDSAKAQSLAFSMTTLGSVLSGTVSGMLYDHISVNAVLWTAAAVCMAGTVLSVVQLKADKI